MKLAIFGATGKTGRVLVEQALAAGHEVTAFVRDLSKLTLGHERLSLVQGDVFDAARVEEAVAGKDAVISVLGRRPARTESALRRRAHARLMHRCRGFSVLPQPRARAFVTLSSAHAAASPFNGVSGGLV